MVFVNFACFVYCGIQIVNSVHVYFSAEFPVVKHTFPVFQDSYFTPLGPYISTRIEYRARVQRCNYRLYISLQSRDSQSVP